MVLIKLLNQKIEKKNQQKSFHDNQENFLFEYCLEK